MAESTNKLTTLTQLQTSMERVATELDKDRSRLTDLEDAESQANVLEGVKVNGTALVIAEKIVEILIATGATNGTIAVNGVDVAVKGLGALAYLSEITEDELSAALKETIDAKADGDDASAMNDSITAILEILDGIGGDGDEYATVQAAISGILSNYYNKTESDAKYVALEEGKGLSTNDYTTAEKEKLAGIAEGATKVENSTTNGNILVDGVEVVVYTEDEDVVHGSVATDTEVTTMLNTVFSSDEETE